MQRRDFLRLNAAVSLLAFTLNGCDRTLEKPAAQAENEAMEDGVGNEVKQAEPKDHIFQDHGQPKPPAVIASGAELELLKSVDARFRRVVKAVGYGNFNILSFDNLLKTAANDNAVGAFTPAEIAYLDRLFHRDAKEYGFYGEKVTHHLIETIDPKEVFKVPYTGHYLYKGRSGQVYDQVKKDVGETIVLTSGVRGVPKQMHLFLAKTLECGGSYSEASRSLAPAGYSYHGIGDFDVGKVGFGPRNFTAEFAHTHEYDRLIKLGYVAIRYPKGNPFGVYFEPWHVEVV